MIANPATGTIDVWPLDRVKYILHAQGGSGDRVQSAVLPQLDVAVDPIFAA